MKKAAKDPTPIRAPEKTAKDTTREAALKAFAFVKAAREKKAAPR